MQTAALPPQRGRAAESLHHEAEPRDEKHDSAIRG